MKQIIISMLAILITYIGIFVLVVIAVTYFVDNIWLVRISIGLMAFLVLWGLFVTLTSMGTGHVLDTLLSTIITAILVVLTAPAVNYTMKNSENLDAALKEKEKLYAAFKAKQKAEARAKQAEQVQPEGSK
ncbi:hypothetical protein [Gimesia panareensis]|uniref:hypothetical protein n=1 Tax=Gimesia panareensis TaxID=2527978 RepID=UPI00118D3FAF|nr:hypothetical protein [Gimesia panareensis]QDU50459.1 hypothetical protein Pan110_28100 [Gimesia panareensis]